MDAFNVAPGHGLNNPGITARGVEDVNRGGRVPCAGYGMPLVPDLVYGLSLHRQVGLATTRQMFDSLKAWMHFAGRSDRLSLSRFKISSKQAPNAYGQSVNSYHF